MAGELYLAPYLEEPDDSGIDSDDAERGRAQPGVELMQLSDTGSSDEELVLRSPVSRSIQRKFDGEMIDMEDEQLEREVLIPMVTWQRPRRDCPDFHSLMLESPDCSSPPLYEVELTASDEDDDTSVLELVIPVQSSRYNRVPSSSPTKAYIMAARLLCRIFCCFCNADYN